MPSERAHTAYELNCNIEESCSAKHSHRWTRSLLRSDISMHAHTRPGLGNGWCLGPYCSGDKDPSDWGFERNV